MLGFPILALLLGIEAIEFPTSLASTIKLGRPPLRRRGSIG